jgi:hypothetical protein
MIGRRGGERLGRKGRREEYWEEENKKGKNKKRREYSIRYNNSICIIIYNSIIV